MKTLVLTGYDEAFRPLGESTSPLMAAYAERHGFDFVCLHDGKGPHPSWWKMHYMLDAFERYERIIWMDADIVVTNPEIVPPGESGYHCSMDWGKDATEPWQLSNCCFSAFRNSTWLIKWCIDNISAVSQKFHEQEHMRLVAEIEDGVTVHPSRVFAAVPIEIHPSVREPWQPGDWVAHLTMVDLAERIRLVGEIKRKSGDVLISK